MTYPSQLTVCVCAGSRFYIVYVLWILLRFLQEKEENIADAKFRLHYESCVFACVYCSCLRMCACIDLVSVAPHADPYNLAQLFQSVTIVYGFTVFLYISFRDLSKNNTHVRKTGMGPSCDKRKECKMKKLSCNPKKMIIKRGVRWRILLCCLDP